MTTHELAARLLKMPNIPIATHMHNLLSPHALIWQKIGLLKSVVGFESIITISVDETK